MSRDVLERRVLRGLAVLIALVAALDPSVTSMRASKPVVAVVGTDRVHDSAQAARVSRTLARDFTVIPAAFSAASATVLVGDGLPRLADLASPVFGVTSSDAPALRLESVRAAASVPLDARVRVFLVARAAGARGRTLTVSLRAGGVVVDRSTRVVSGDDEHIPLSLDFLPTSAGAAQLRVEAELSGARTTAAADLGVDARDTPWPVLFYDPRPSWMSTFVRRALERDRRFVVTSRVLTSRNISSDAGQPPNTLDDLAGIERFDAIIVGAPDALTSSDVAGLDRFARERGGSVVLLLDQTTAGPYDELTGVRRWNTHDAGVVSIARTPADTAGLRASELAWPEVMPPGAEPFALTTAIARDSANGRPILWHTPVGAGQLIVSGALDAWRYRDRSDFDRFWQTTVGDAASASPPALAIATANEVATGERSNISVTVRDAALRGSLPARAIVSAMLVASGDTNRSTIRLLPSGRLGELRGAFRAPTAPGVYRVVASSGGSSSEAAIVVSPTVTHALADTRALLAAWVAAHGGQMVPESRIGDLPSLLQTSLRPRPRAETWHPMRSAWWIVPFALALGGEWWLRRRRGLA